MEKQRVLVAEDDARWKLELSRSSTAKLVYVEHLSDALRMIDRRRRWTGAIFDRYLLEGDLPFSSSHLVSEGGFLQTTDGRPILGCDAIRTVGR